MSLQDSEDKEILEAVKPIAEQLEAGWNENDYQKFIKHVAIDKKESIDINNFNKQRTESINVLGKSTLGQLVKIHKNPNNIVIIWEILFEKRPEPGLGVYRFIESNGTITVESSLHHH